MGLLSGSALWTAVGDESVVFENVDEDRDLGAGSFCYLCEREARPGKAPRELLSK